MGPVQLETAPRSSGSARSRSTIRARTSWRECASCPVKAWMSCSTGSAARCRFARSARYGQADGLSYSATPPRLCTDTRVGEGGSSGTPRPRRSRSGACSRPAGACPHTASRSCAKATRLFPWGAADRSPSVEVRAIRNGSARTSLRCSSCSVRARSTRSWPSACRCPTLVARTSYSRAPRRRGSSCSCHKPARDALKTPTAATAVRLERTRGGERARTQAPSSTEENDQVGLRRDRAHALTVAGAGENVSSSKPVTERSGGFGISRPSCYSSMPSLRSSTIAALRQRTVSGANGSVNGHPVRLAERLTVAQDAVVPRRRLDREPHGFEPADELAHVLPHLGPEFERRTSLPTSTAAGTACLAASPLYVLCTRARADP